MSVRVVQVSAFSEFCPHVSDLSAGACRPGLTNGPTPDRAWVRLDQIDPRIPLKPEYLWSLGATEAFGRPSQNSNGE